MPKVTTSVLADANAVKPQFIALVGGPEQEQ
jgi:hypothetical protein